MTAHWLFDKPFATHCLTRSGKKRTCHCAFSRTYRRPTAEQTSSASCTTSASLTSLQRSAQLALHRSFESDAAQPLFQDPFAETLAAQVELQGNGARQGAAEDVLSTWFVDQQLLQGAALVNMDLKQDYRQVVLIGDAMDTRPYRLPWPAGTVLYLVGAPEVHEFAEAVMQQQGAHVPRGCLLRRVRWNLKSHLEAARGSQLGSLAVQDLLEQAGYRADRLSLWGLQGYPVSYQNPLLSLQRLLLEVTQSAAFGSIVVGQLTGIQPAAADQLLGSFGLLGAASTCRGAAEHLAQQLDCIDGAVSMSAGAEGGLVGEGGDAAEALVGEAEIWSGGGRCAEAWRQGRIEAWLRVDKTGGVGVNAGGGLSPSVSVGEGMLLFSAQHKNLSLKQMQLRDGHIAAAAEVDEDFFGNFS